MDQVTIAGVMRCGYCKKVLGSLEDLTNSEILNTHICLQKFSNVTIDEQNFIHGMEEKENTGETSPPPPPNVLHVPSEQAQELASNSKTWTYDATKKLISLYKEEKQKFESPMYSHKKVWEIISQRLKAKNVFFSADKCSEKWRNLKKSYDRNRKEREATGSSPKFWIFYEDLHDIYFKDPHFNPVFTVSSTGAIKRQRDEFSEQENHENDTNKTENLASKKSAASVKTDEYSKKEIEDRKQKRHEERMKQKEEMFEWFKQNFKKE